MFKNTINVSDLTENTDIKVISNKGAKRYFQDNLETIQDHIRMANNYRNASLSKNADTSVIDSQIDELYKAQFYLENILQIIDKDEKNRL